MTVRLEGDTIRLEGDCPIEDAEALLRHLSEAPGRTVDWRDCEGAHTAVVQILLASGAIPRGPPAGVFLRDRVEPLLKGSGSISPFPKRSGMT